MSDQPFCRSHPVSIVACIVAILIGIICLTAGYAVNKKYNAEHWQTSCTYMIYNFRPFPWNNWNCKGCTAYYASITTMTADNRIWYTHQATVYPPGNSVDRQTRWYQAHWPIGQTVTCWQSACCSNAPIFELADVDGTFWAGIAFLSIAALIAGILIIVYLCGRGYCCCRKAGYTVLDDSKAVI